MLQTTLGTGGPPQKPQTFTQVMKDFHPSYTLTFPAPSLKQEAEENLEQDHKTSFLKLKLSGC